MPSLAMMAIHRLVPSSQDDLPDACWAARLVRTDVFNGDPLTIAAYHLGTQQRVGGGLNRPCDLRADVIKGPLKLPWFRRADVFQDGGSPVAAPIPRPPRSDLEMAISREVRSGMSAVCSEASRVCTQEGRRWPYSRVGQTIDVAIAGDRPQNPVNSVEYCLWGYAAPMERAAMSGRNCYG